MVPALVVPIVAAAWAVRRTTKPTAGWLLVAGALPIVGAILVDLSYNWWRFGSISNNGHEGDGALSASWQLGPGLFGQVLSPGKGLLLLSPLALVALYRWRHFARRDTLLATAIGGAVVLNVVARTRRSRDGRATRPGEHALRRPGRPTRPGATRVRGAAAARRGRLHPAARAMTMLLAIVGLAMQLTGVLVDFFAVVTSRRLRGESTTTDQWHLPYVDGAGILLRALRHSQPYPDLTPGWIESLQPAGASTCGGSVPPRSRAGTPRRSGCRWRSPALVVVAAWRLHGALRTASVTRAGPTIADYSTSRMPEGGRDRGLRPRQVDAELGELAGEHVGGGNTARSEVS